MQIYLTSFLVFLFGAIIGSFLNVVICRLNTGKVFSGRSKCFCCNKILSWNELVPLFSFVIQKGKCKSCKSEISFQYFFVELLTGLIFLLLFLKFGLSLIAIFFALVFSILIIIAVYDYYHKIIPDGLVYTFSFLALIFQLYNQDFFTNFKLINHWDILIGPILFLFFATLWFVSSGRWMGLGDAKLSLGVGWMLGFYGGMTAIILAFWVGALVGIILLFFKGFYDTMKHEIPFAPFIILATALAFFFELDVVTLLIF